MENTHEEERHGLQIKIIHDEEGQNPSEWDDSNVFLVGYHRSFTVEAPQVTWPKERWQVADHKSVCQSCGQRNFKTVEESGNKCGACEEASRVNKTYYKKTGEAMFSQNDLVAYFQKRKWDYNFDFKAFHVFGLEAYIHSGVCLALSNEGNFVDRQWDVSQLGAVLVKKTEARTKAKARKIALGLIEGWNDCLSGNVYGFRIEDSEGNELDSCWGFIGDYDAKGGVLDEARSRVDSLTNNGTTDHNGQTLLEFAKA